MAEIVLIRGDITKVSVDAIVNAANHTLRGGGGVDGAIHAAGGHSILEECRQVVKDRGELPTGQAIITGAGKLPAKYVIHTVGPVYNAAARKEMQILLAACYTNSLHLALEHACDSVAFPNISTGVYGFPKRDAARIATEAVQAFVSNQNSLKKICYVCFDSENYEIYAGLLK
jgi:O-acetyl-ADP-ribose deacetylase (regulator of RNase III)